MTVMGAELLRLAGERELAVGPEADGPLRSVATQIADVQPSGTKVPTNSIMPTHNTQLVVARRTKPYCWAAFERRRPGCGICPPHRARRIFPNRPKGLATLSPLFLFETLFR